METPKKYQSLFGDLTLDELKAKAQEIREARQKRSEEKAKQKEAENPPT